MPIQTAEQARRVFKTPRDLTRTDAGRVRSKITDLQRQTNLNKDETSRLKELRRDWNRNLKYTREGMALSGATSPLDAQNRFMRSTEDFRQINPQAYGRMYPLSQTAMQLSEYGGLLGLGARALTGKLGDYYKDILGNKGIGGALDTDEDELENYANLTYNTDIHPGLPIDDVPLLVDDEPIRGVDVVDDITVSDLPVEPKPDPNILDPDYLTWDYEYGDDYTAEGIPKRPPEVIPGYETSYVDRFAPVEEDTTAYEDYIDRGLQEPLPFDEGREDYIAASGMDPNLLRREKLRGMDEIPRNFVPGGSPQADRYYQIPNIGVEFGDNVAPPPINYRDDPRTESGIANLMPGGPLYDAIPMGQRLNRRIAQQMLERGPHANEPRTSYYGPNWYEEYKRKMENEMEVNRGIRSPIDR